MTENNAGKTSASGPLLLPSSGLLISPSRIESAPSGAEQIPAEYSMTHAEALMTQGDSKFLFRVDDIELEIRSITGIAAGSSARAETHVSGYIGGGGGVSYNGTGGVAPVHGSITSSTTVVGDHFLIDQAGNENHIRTIDFELPMRDGHPITFAYISKQASKDQSLFFGYNGATKAVIVHKKIIEKQIGLPLLIGSSLLTGAVAVVLYFASQIFYALLIGAVAVVLYAKYIKRKEALVTNQDIPKIYDRLKEATNSLKIASSPSREA